MNSRLILLPFSLIYSGIVALRNWLYNHNILHSTTFDIPVICVGNITVGGTGKTPFIEYILRTLESSNTPAIVSRGYRRKTKGLVIAAKDSTTQDIGDEPFQMHNKFPNIPIAVDGNRNKAIKWIKDNTSCNVVLMDDGFQHRSTKASFYVLMTDYARPMWSDWTFPSGNLREPWHGRHRADIIIVNKCPENLSEKERDDIKKRLNVSCPIYFASITYGELRRHDATVANEDIDKALAIAGIGRPAPFFEEVKRRVKDTQCIEYADHHNFSADDFNNISSVMANDGRRLITTEKDATRLANSGLDYLFIPIELKILFGQGKELNKIINDAVEAKTK